VTLPSICVAQMLSEIHVAKICTIFLFWNLLNTHDMIAKFIVHAEKVLGWPALPHKIEKENKRKLEAKDVLPNINCTQAAERAKNAIFCPW